MNICEQFKAALLLEQRRGMTQEKIAERHGVSQQTISRMLRQNSTCEGATLGLVQKMFPHATLNLTGSGNITQFASNVRVNNGSVNSIQQGKSASAYRQEAIAAMIALDLPGDTLKLVLNTLMGIEA